MSSFDHELCYFNPNSRYFPRFDGNLYQCVRFLAAKITVSYLFCHAGAAGAGVMACHGAKSQGLPCSPRKSSPSARRLRRLPPLQRHTVGQPRRGGRGRRRAAWSPQQKVVAVERRCLFQVNDHVKLLLVKTMSVSMIVLDSMIMSESACKNNMWFLNCVHLMIFQFLKHHKHGVFKVISWVALSH